MIFREGSFGASHVLSSAAYRLVERRGELFGVCRWHFFCGSRRRQDAKGEGFLRKQRDSPLARGVAWR